MQKKENIILAVLCVLVVATLFGIFRGPKVIIEQPAAPLGSASLDGTDSTKSITTTDASSTASVVVRGGAGVLDYLTIASSSAAFTGGGQGIRVYDGTATSTGTLITTIKSNTVEGTYLINRAILTGIVLDVPVGFTGSFLFGFK